MNCLQCKHIGLKAAPAMTIAGTALCGVRSGEYPNFRRERECKWFALAKAQIVASRQRWAEGIAK